MKQRTNPSNHIVLNRFEVVNELSSPEDLADRYRFIGENAADLLENAIGAENPSEAVLSICSSMVESLKPKCADTFIELSNTSEEARHVPGIKSRVNTMSSGHRSSDSMNEFSSVPYYSVEFDANTMVPQKDLDDMMSYTDISKIHHTSQDEAEKDNITRSSIKNMSSFALRSKDFTSLGTSMQTANSQPTQEHALNTYGESSPEGNLSNFSSSPNEFLSPYDTTHSHLFSQ